MFQSLDHPQGARIRSLLKLYVKMLITLLYLSVMWQHIVICCHITDKCNDIFTILTYNFSKEQYVLPEDDLRIEICRSILSVLI